MTRAAIAALLAVTGCIRPADERSTMDTRVGIASAGGVDFAVEAGQAQVLTAEPGRLVVWAQAPVLRVVADVGGGGDTDWEIVVNNCMPDAAITATGDGSDPLPASRTDADRPTVCRFDVDLAGAARAEIAIAPPDADIVERYQFVVMGDVQTGIVRVEDIWEMINADPELRFVVMTGDEVENGEPDDYEEWLDKLELLDLPLYATIGNHELNGDAELWHDLFGLFNVHFEFKGVSFSFLDSGNASLDPIVYDRLDGWLDDAADRIHLFGTHYPAFDPVGTRNASFRSRREANKLLARLAAGGVDVTFYGHIHSYYTLENAGIPAFISGGGGGIPERFDGIGRHYLKVDADPERRTVEVAVIRVD